MVRLKFTFPLARGKVAEDYFPIPGKVNLLGKLMPPKRKIFNGLSKEVVFRQLR